MNFKTKTRVWFVLGCFGLILGALYNNCGGTQQGTGLLSANNLESGIYSDEGDPTAVSLSIAQDPIFIQNGDIGFNVGGFCETGNFFSNEITWDLKTINGASVIPPTTISDACGDKRFSISVLLPGSFNYQSQHVIQMKISVKDSTGAVKGSAQAMVNISTL